MFIGYLAEEATCIFILLAILQVKHESAILFLWTGARHCWKAIKTQQSSYGSFLQSRPDSRLYLHSKLLVFVQNTYYLQHSCCVKHKLPNWTKPACMVVLLFITIIMTGGGHRMQRDCVTCNFLQWFWLRMLPGHFLLEKREGAGDEATVIAALTWLSDLCNSACFIALKVGPVSRITSQS